MEPSKEQSNNGYNQPGLIRRIISYPLTSLEIGTYLLKCALFGDEVEGHDPASELEKELCRVHLEEEELPEEIKDLFWERYNKLPKPENNRYNAAALVEKIGKGLAEAYKKGIFRSIASFFSDKKRKTGLELAEDIAKEYRDLRNRISTSKAFLNRFSNKLYSSETNGGYDTTAANVYATSQAIIEEESKKLNLVHNVDPWKHIFLQLWNKVSIDYAFKGSSAVVNDWKEAMRTYNNRMRDMQKIAKKTKMPEVAEEMLEVLVKDTHKAISSHILDRFERGASDKDNNEQIDKLIKFYTSFSLAYKHILYPNLRLEKTRSQRRHMFINNVVRADLIDKLTNLNLAQLNGHLNVRYLSGLIRSYERFVRSLCPPEQNGQLDKE
ncbi:hypothetical protein KY340_03230, partial [Candidatus Woesearchaeota archaeon]|nr:hypothetical protein [Candidatus Woesearchaeota archaeon]